MYGRGVLELSGGSIDAVWRGNGKVNYKHPFSMTDRDGHVTNYDKVTTVADFILCSISMISLSENIAGLWVGVHINKKKAWGKITLLNCDVYYGQWKNNKYHGCGTYVNCGGGTVYHGLFKKGVKDGMGVEVIKRNDVNGNYEERYCGNWANGKRSGVGILSITKMVVNKYCRNTTIKRFYQYKGYFQNNKRHGAGWWREPIECKNGGNHLSEWKDGRNTEGWVSDEKLTELDEELCKCCSECAIEEDEKDNDFNEKLRTVVRSFQDSKGPLQEN